MFRAVRLISCLTLLVKSLWNIHQPIKVKNITICGLNSTTNGICAELNYNNSPLDRRLPPVNLRTTSSPKWEICHWSDGTGLCWPLTLGASCMDWSAALRSLMSWLQVNENMREQQGDGRILTWMRLLETKGNSFSYQFKDNRCL